MPNQNNAAKFAFYYMLSLVALIFMALATGGIVFQIINKYFSDPIGLFQGTFNSDALRTAISALFFSAPIFFVLTWQIFKNLFSGNMEEESGIRKWLTYLILFASAVVMLVWLIVTLNNFLKGELTAKFALKALTSLIIAGSIFVFYLYDIKRKDIKGKKDKVISIYFYASALIVAVVFVTSLFFIESPAKTRDRNHDNILINNLDQIESAVNSYYSYNKKLPDNLKALTGDANRQYFISSDSISDPETKKELEYKKIKTDSYEICAEFKLSNKIQPDDSSIYNKDLEERWPHDAGRTCYARKAMVIKDSAGNVIQIPIGK
jgi:hypothetical protein